jgi:putative aldouronate transport system permease protein
MLRRFGRNRIRRSAGEITFDSVNVLLMIALCVVMIYPFWYVLVYALNETQDAQYGRLWFFPRIPTLFNIGFVLNNPMLKGAYMITILRTLIGPAVHLVVTGCAAYALSKRYLPGRKVITYFLIVPMFIGGTMISYYVVYAKLGLLNNFLVYVLPPAFSFFMMAITRAFLEEIPASLEESAKMDGAGYLRIFLRIMIPLSTPIVATVLMISAVGHWLDFFTNLLYVNKYKLFTVQFLLYNLVQQKTNVGQFTGAMVQSMQGRGSEKQVGITIETMKMTMLVVATLPVLFVYPFFQKYIIKGILIGAIKE